jgi:hypothetical protein
MELVIYLLKTGYLVQKRKKGNTHKNKILISKAYIYIFIKRISLQNDFQGASPGDTHTVTVCVYLSSHYIKISCPLLRQIIFSCPCAYLTRILYVTSNLLLEPQATGPWGLVYRLITAR